MTTDIIILTANVALTLSVIVAIFFGMTQVKLANRDRKERLTLETLRTFETKEFAELVQFLNDTSFPETYEQFRPWDKDHKVHFVQLLQHMESLGILLSGKLIDLDLVDKTLGAIVVASWQKFKPVVLDMRGDHGDPFVAQYFQWMAERLGDKKKQQQPRPAYAD